MATEIREQRYKEERPAETFQPVHEWIRTHRPGPMYELVRMLTTWPAVFLYRCWSYGGENVPASGGFILAPNHFSNMDHFFAGAYTLRKIQFMAKSQLYANRVLTYIFQHGGVFPVMRGHHDDEAFKTAHAVLDRGGCVGMYCEGGRSRTGTLGEAKPGVGRLALESGMPVVPTAIHGSANARNWKKLSFPKVTVQFGEPISFERVENPSREAQLEAATVIFDQVKAMYDVLESEGRAGAKRRLAEQPTAAA
ncbi:hypothetical protein BH10ACT11_BH10ACT11_10310 [soil metagenome]